MSKINSFHFQDFVLLIEQTKDNPQDFFKAFGDGEIVSGFLTPHFHDVQVTISFLKEHKSQMLDILAWYLGVSFKKEEKITSFMCKVVWDVVRTLHCDDAKIFFKKIKEAGGGPILNEMTHIRNREWEYHFLNLFKNEQVADLEVFDGFDIYSMRKIAVVVHGIEDISCRDVFLDDAVKNSCDEGLDEWLLDDNLYKKALWQLKQNLECYLKDNPQKLSWQENCREQMPNFCKIVEKEMILKSVKQNETVFMGRLASSKKM